MPTVALAGNQFRRAVTINIDQRKSMRLREGFVNRVSRPRGMLLRATLLQPVKPVAMPLAIDQVEPAVMVYVVPEIRKAGITKIPVAVPLPLVVIRVDLLKPAVRRQDVRLAVAIDVSHADPMPVLLTTAEMVHPRLVLAEVNPEHTGAIVVRQGNIRLAVPIDVGKGAAFGVEAVRDPLTLPHGAGCCGLRSRVLVPPQTILDPTRRNQVGQAIMIDIDDPLSAIRDELLVRANQTELMLLPCTTRRPRVLIPIGATQQILKAISIHVEQ